MLKQIAEFKNKPLIDIDESTLTLPASVRCGDMKRSKRVNLCKESYSTTPPPVVPVYLTLGWYNWAPSHSRAAPASPRHVEKRATDIVVDQ